jgi:hypothetical protein
MMNPDPCPMDCHCCDFGAPRKESSGSWSKKSRKNGWSAKGSPPNLSGAEDFAIPGSFATVLIETTAGSVCFATSRKERERASTTWLYAVVLSEVPSLTPATTWLCKVFDVNTLCSRYKQTPPAMVRANDLNEVIIQLPEKLVLAEYE